MMREACDDEKKTIVPAETVQVNVPGEGTLVPAGSTHPQRFSKYPSLI